MCVKTQKIRIGISVYGMDFQIEEIEAIDIS